VGEKSKADQTDELVECNAESLVEAVEPGTLGWGKDGIAGNGIEQTGGKGSAQPIEEFQENQADGIALGG
jgi:hypothetical protein